MTSSRFFLRPVLSQVGLSRTSPAEGLTMDWRKAGKILRSACHRDDDAAVLSRRDALAGIGLAGVFLFAGPKLLAPAEARPIDAPAIDPETIAADATRA